MQPSNDYPPYAQQSPYPPQPYLQPTPPPAPKKPRRWPWFLAIIIALVIGYAVGSASHTSGDTANNSNSNGNTAQTTPGAQSAAKPTQAPAKWSVTNTFKGSGNKKTATFSVGNDWKLQWKCDPASFQGIQYNVIVMVDNSDNSPADPGAINSLCKPGSISGETEEHTSGNVYLDITSEADWTITVQQLK